jgi:hypothetical protein
MVSLKHISILATILGFISIVIGGIFIGIAQHENSYITSQLRDQGVTLGLTQDQIAKGEVVHNAAEAQTAAATLAKHLKSIAPSYSALMASNPSGRFDPTNPTDLTYGQGLNLLNSMNIVILGYGVVEAITGTGAALVVVGLGLATGGLIMLKLAAKREEVRVKQYETEARLVGVGSTSAS